MARMTRNDVRNKARETVQFYSLMRISDDASVRKGSLAHLDPSLDPTEGWWVDCQVFVPREEE